ncbi:MAG: hypothetical protein QOH38_703, partial [Thermoleophilaceae bacterium]|nr:hypothetical protein [Thermoleophilaceae bacterium]
MKRISTIFCLIAALALSIGAASVLASHGADDPANHDAGENACLSPTGGDDDATDDNGGTADNSGSDD